MHAHSHVDLPKRWRFLSSVAIAFFIAIDPAFADGWIDIEPALVHYDNLTRAQHAADRRSDTAAALQASAAYLLALTGADTIGGSLDVRGEAYRQYPRLDVMALGAGASYRHKFGLGSTMPWMLASVSYAREDYRDDLRDGERLRLALEIGRRVSDALDVAAGISAEHRSGDFNPPPPLPGYSARVFDLRGKSAYARTGVALSDRLFLSARLTVRRGDVESTAQQGFAIFVASDAIAQDPAFRDPSLYAYRLHATTYSAQLTASWAMSDRASVNLTYADNRSRAAYDLSYDDRALRVSVALRYP